MSDSKSVDICYSDFKIKCPTCKWSGTISLPSWVNCIDCPSGNCFQQFLLRNNVPNVQPNKLILPPENVRAEGNVDTIVVHGKCWFRKLPYYLSKEQLLLELENEETVESGKPISGRLLVI